MLIDYELTLIDQFIDDNLLILYQFFLTLLADGFGEYIFISPSLIDNVISYIATLSLTKQIIRIKLEQTGKNEQITPILSFQIKFKSSIYP